MKRDDQPTSRVMRSYVRRVFMERLWCTVLTIFRLPSGPMTSSKHLILRDSVDRSVYAFIVELGLIVNAMQLQEVKISGCRFVYWCVGCKS